MGLSPLARGNHSESGPGYQAPGPIPARAGKPEIAVSARDTCGAYPRSRGETPPLRHSLRCLCGLSPLARGNRVHVGAHAANRGPIPARAGKPTSPCSAPAHSGAYPRSRGETPSSDLIDSAVWGLSPLARGNPEGYEHGQPRHGPIPARAGKPNSGLLICAQLRAYPRSRGETGGCACQALGDQGLSPLARGNPWFSPSPSFRPGPIPARAGKPERQPAPA